MTVVVGFHTWSDYGTKNSNETFQHQDNLQRFQIRYKMNLSCLKKDDLNPVSDNLVIILGGILTSETDLSSLNLDFLNLSEFLEL